VHLRASMSIFVGPRRGDPPPDADCRPGPYPTRSHPGANRSEQEPPGHHQPGDIERTDDSINIRPS
jgi:hypothetical protein